MCCYHIPDTPLSVLVERSLEIQKRIEERLARLEARLPADTKDSPDMTVRGHVYIDPPYINGS